MLLVIFGAGASRDAVPAHLASAPEEYKHPLTTELFAQRQVFVNVLREPDLSECAPMVGELRALLRGDDPIPLEQHLQNYQDLVEKGYPHIARQLASLRLYLVRILVACDSQTLLGSAGITNYVLLLQRLRNWQQENQAERVCLVTFNHDRLLEDAVRRVYQLRIEQLGDYITHPQVTIIKPHGSIHWFRKIAKPPGGWPRVWGFTEQLLNSAEDPHLGDWVLLPNPASEPAMEGTPCWPMLAIPVTTKRAFACPEEHLAVLREMAGETTRLLVVGWRGLEPHFLDLLSERLPFEIRGHVVNGSSGASTDTAERIRNAWRIREPVVLDLGFTQYLQEENTLSSLLE